MHTLMYNSEFVFLFQPMPEYRTFSNPEQEVFQISVRKRENAGNLDFLLFPQFFPILPKLISILDLHPLQSNCTCPSIHWIFLTPRCYRRPLLQACLLPDLNTILNNCVRKNSLYLSGCGIDFSSRRPWFKSCSAPIL